MARIEKFPQEIYVVIDEDGNGSYLCAVSDAKRAEDALTSRDKTRVATYKLANVQEGSLEPVFSAEVSE